MEYKGYKLAEKVIIRYEDKSLLFLKKFQMINFNDSGFKLFMAIFSAKELDEIKKSFKNISEDQINTFVNRCVEEGFLVPY